MPVPEIKPGEIGPDHAPGTTAWEIQIAQFNDHQIAELGLKQLFEGPLRTNAAPEAEIQNRAFAGLARSKTNVALEIRSSVYQGICSSETASNLIETLEATAGVDLLTCPPATLFRTNQARVAVQDSLSLVFPPSAGTGNPWVTNVSVGQVIDLRAIGMKGDATIIQLASWIEQFKGYADPPKTGSTNAKAPILDLAVLAVTTRLGPGEALLLGSTIDRSVRRIVERVPYLSDIPVAGRLFTKIHVETNYLRELVIVRPKPNSD
jgi:hypothetical protein